MTLAKINPKTKQNKNIGNISEIFKRLLQRPRILFGQYCCVPFMQKKRAIRLQMKNAVWSVSVIKGGVLGMSIPFGIARSLSTCLRSFIWVWYGKIRTDSTCLHFTYWTPHSRIHETVMVVINITAKTQSSHIGRKTPATQNIHKSNPLVSFRSIFCTNKRMNEAYLFALSRSIDINIR